MVESERSMTSTIIFEDDFETGDFSKWTGTVGTPSIVTDPVHHGTYGMKADGGAYENEYAYKTFTPYSTIYARAYLRWPTNPTLDNRLDGMIVLLGAWGSVVQGGIINDAGTMKWLLTYLSDTSYLTAMATTPVPTVDTWFCMELKGLVSGTVGEARLYIDGNEVITVTGLDNDGMGNIQELRVGNYAAITYPLFTWTDYVDCLVVSDEYVGPEVPPPVAGAKALIGGLYLVFPD